MKLIQVLVLIGILSLLPGCMATIPANSSNASNSSEAFDFGGPGRGAVIMKTDSVGLICASSAMGIAIQQKVPDSVELRQKRIQIANYLYNEQNITGFTLPAGDYVVDTIYCTGNRVARHLKGNFARFSVKDGEIVKIGVLDYRYTPDSMIGIGVSGVVEFSTRPFNEAEIEYLERRLPAAKSLMVTRLMMPIEPNRRHMR